MSRYYSFNDFMNDVLELSNEYARQRNSCGLEDLYQVSSSTYTAILMLIGHGWGLFTWVVALLALGWVALCLALGGALTTPIGWTVVAVLGGGAAVTIKNMYKDRILPNTVKEVGERYKPLWEKVEGNSTEVDELRCRAAEELYHRAKNPKYRL